MNAKDQSIVTSETLASLRVHPDAIRLISERLGVKEMGPADHIRTKHDVKAYVQSGDRQLAEELLKSAEVRRRQQQGATIKVAQKLGESRKP